MSVAAVWMNIIKDHIIKHLLRTCVGTPGYTLKLVSNVYE